MGTKTTGLPTLASPLSEDLLAMVDDPGGTPDTRNVALGNIWQSTLLYDVTLAANGTFDASGLSQDYDHLLIHAYTRSTVVADLDQMRLYFNGDTTATNYHTQEHLANNGSSHAVAEFTYPFFGYCTAVNSATSSYGFLWAEIPFYSDPATIKVARTECGLLRAAANVLLDKNTIAWTLSASRTNAITGLTIQTDNHSTDVFRDGSRVRVMGVRKGA